MKIGNLFLILIPFFDGYIVPGWTDYPVTALNVGDSLRLYHVDDSQEKVLACY